MPSFMLISPPTSYSRSRSLLVEFYCQETFLDDRVLYLLEGQSEP
jgi:hypothetical protein